MVIKKIYKKQLEDR